MLKKKDILTIPNLLSTVRLLLIPVIIWLYCKAEDYTAALVVLILSGVTDVVDGIIARKCNMVSDFGKILDPVADKLTQFAVLLCLVSRFPNFLPLAVFLAVKEMVTGIMGLIAIKRAGAVYGADWHGKVTTVLLYATMAVHILWVTIPAAVSNGLIGLCGCMMIYSGARYLTRYIKMIRGKDLQES